MISLTPFRTCPACKKWHLLKRSVCKCGFIILYEAGLSPYHTSRYQFRTTSYTITVNELTPGKLSSTIMRSGWVWSNEKSVFDGGFVASIPVALDPGKTTDETIDKLIVLA